MERFPSAHIVEEYYTGTKTLGRGKWNKLYALVAQEVEAGKKVTLVFDSASRMSRNADEGYDLYEHLFRMGVNLVFLKEPHINTDVYRNATKIQVEMTGTNADILLKAVNEYLLAVAKEQIQLVFEQAEKEVKDLHQRTSEGMKTAKLNGKQIGRIKGRKYETKKSIAAKKIIMKNSIAFGGSNTDIEVMRIADISRNAYYKYKKELIKEIYKPIAKEW